MRIAILSAIIVNTACSVYLFMNSTSDDVINLILKCVIQGLALGNCFLLCFQVLGMFPTRYRCTSLSFLFVSYRITRTVHYFLIGLMVLLLLKIVICCIFFCSFQYNSATYGAYIPILFFATVSWLLIYFLLPAGSNDLPDLEREALLYHIPYPSDSDIP